MPLEVLQQPSVEEPETLQQEPDATVEHQAEQAQDEQQSTKKKKVRQPVPPTSKRAISVEGFVAAALIIAMFLPIGIIMGFGNMMQTLFNNAHHLLIDVCFYLMGIAVVVGALSNVLSEFGVISLLNKALSPLMKPLYGMPGATSMAIFSSFLSDNPATLTLAADRRYRRYFKKYQLAALTNVGTAFGMGLIVIVTMLTKKPSDGDGKLGLAILAGVLGTLTGSIVCSRLMLFRAKRMFGTEEEAEPSNIKYDTSSFREIREGGRGQRFFSSLLEGGASGVSVGLAIVPGVLIIANLVMLLTDGAGEGGAFTGAMRQGVALFPWIGDKLSWLFKFLFGFKTTTAVSVPITALGSAGAALGLIGDFVYSTSEIAVFTGMCMFWSGYLSTHVSMMDTMGFRKLTGSSILFHTIGGLIAGIVANYSFMLFSLF